MVADECVDGNPDEDLPKPKVRIRYFIHVSVDKIIKTHSFSMFRRIPVLCVKSVSYVLLLFQQPPKRGRGRPKKVKY